MGTTGGGVEYLKLTAADPIEIVFPMADLAEVLEADSPVTDFQSLPVRQQLRVQWWSGIFKTHSSDRFFNCYQCDNNRWWIDDLKKHRLKMTFSIDLAEVLAITPNFQWQIFQPLS